MKKISIIFALILISISVFAYDSDTCKIDDGVGSSVVATVSSGATGGIVYVNLMNDSKRPTIVKVEVSDGDYSGSDTFLVPAEGSLTDQKIKLNGTTHIVNPNNVKITIGGARCQ